MLSNAIRVAEDTAVGNGRPQIKAEVMCSAPAATLVKESKHAEMVVVGSRGQSTWPRPTRIGQHRVGTPRSLPGCGDP
jgi:hypothetical protein